MCFRGDPRNLFCRYARRHVRDAVRSVKWGLLPEMPDRPGLFDGIMGISALTDKRLVFDFKKKLLSVKL